MATAKPRTYSLLLREREIPLTLKKIRGARRITIHWRPLSGDALVTLPYYASVKDAVAFAESRKGWLEKRMQEQREPEKLTPGMVLGVLGKGYVLKHEPLARGVVREEEGALVVCGEETFFARRLKDWLKARAKAEIEARARVHAEVLGRKIRRISLRETTSRWGSCSADGALSFSWRLIFAPAGVLDYVVAHEVAHLAEMNHSARFWRVVEQLCPGYEKPYAWLRAQGHTLYKYH